MMPVFDDGDRIDAARAEGGDEDGSRRAAASGVIAPAIALRERIGRPWGGPR